MADASADPTLDALWVTYRTWAATSEYYRKMIDSWSVRTLWLAVSGAILSTLGQQMQWKVAGVVGSLMIALATFFTAQILSSDNEKLWTKSRSAAESLKSTFYLYRARVTPFSGDDRTAALAERVNTVVEPLKSLAPRVSDGKQIGDTSALSVSQYLVVRVDDQVTYYLRKAKLFQDRGDRFRMLVLALGVLSVLLGVGAALFNMSAWVSVIATATTAITAYVKNRRYQGLVALYTDTANRLMLLKAGWTQSGKGEADKSDRDAFIRRCEETMSQENGSWFQQWTDEGPSQTT